MSETELGREKLIIAMIDYCTDFVKNEMSFSNENIAVSTRFEQKMQKLIKRIKNPLWKLVNTTGKKIAVFVLAFLMIFGLSMTIEAVREPIFRFAVVSLDKFSEFFVKKSEQQNAPDEIEEVYILTDVPEGYTEYDTYMSKHVVCKTWKNGDRKLVFFQGTLSFKSTSDSEHSEQKIIMLGNIEIICFIRNDEICRYTNIFWRTDSYFFNITIDEILSEAEVIHYVQSVKPE